MKRVLLIGAAVLGTSAPSLFAVTPVSRSSTVYMYLSQKALMDPTATVTEAQDGTTSFDPYTHAVSLNGGDASQTTSVWAAGASATLNSKVNLEQTQFGGNYSRSTFSYTFDVSDATPFSLTGSTSAVSIFPVVATGTLPARSNFLQSNVSLTGPGAAISLSATDNSHPFDYSGTLTPGTYTFSTETFASDSQPGLTGNTASLTANLVVPEPASLSSVAVLGLLARRRRRAF